MSGIKTFLAGKKKNTGTQRVTGGPEPHTHRAAISQYPFTHVQYTSIGGFASFAARPSAHHQHPRPIPLLPAPAMNFFAMPRGQCMPCGAAVSMSTRLSRERQLHGHKDRVYHMGWSPQATRLASVGQTGGFVWSIDGGERVALGGNEVMRVCWHLDGTRVLTGSSLGKISVHAAVDGANVATLEASHMTMAGSLHRAESGQIE